MKKATKLINTSKLSHDEWLEWRKKGIGGSDAAAVAGLSPYKSAVAVFLDKTGKNLLAPPKGLALKIGTDLEAYVAQLFEWETGKKVRRNNYMMAHPDYDFMIANIDREVVGENAILECKTTNSFAAKDWKDGAIPPHYEIQCLHYMAVTGAERCYIAVLIGNRDFQWRTIERDEETILALEEIETAFWNNHVLADVAPAPDGSDQFDEYLNKKYSPNGDDMELSGDFEIKFQRLKDVKSLIKEMQSEQKTIEQEIKDAMGDFETAKVGAFKATWKNETRSGFDKKKLQADHPTIYSEYVTSSTNRVFRVK